MLLYTAGTNGRGGRGQRRNVREKEGGPLQASTPHQTSLRLAATPMVTCLSFVEYVDTYNTWLIEDGEMQVREK